DQNCAREHVRGAQAGRRIRARHLQPFAARVVAVPGRLRPGVSARARSLRGARARGGLRRRRAPALLRVLAVDLSLPAVPAGAGTRSGRTESPAGLARARVLEARETRAGGVTRVRSRLFAFLRVGFGLGLLALLLARVDPAELSALAQRGDAPT